MNIMCPNGCGSDLKEDGVDSRQEWTTIDLHCPKCNKEFTYREDYAIQSHRIVSQTLIDEDGKAQQF